MKKWEILILLLILIGAFAVRLYKFERPVADWHSWRQVDTSAVSRNFVKYGFDILHPRFDDLSKGVSLLDNPEGYRFVEFPIYNVVQAGLYLLFARFTLEEWGRLITVFSQLISIIFIYLLVRRYISKRAGIISSLFFAFIPFNVYYGRTILVESSMVTALLTGIYFFDKWLDKISNLNPRFNRGQISKPQLKTQIFFILSIAFTALALLLKPFALFFTLPIVYLAFNRFGFGFLKKWQIWIFFVSSILPLVLWRVWMLQFPEGIPQSNWLFNGNGIRFKGAFFHWLFAERISKLILGYFGLPFVILGILVKTKKDLFFLSFLASSLIYMTVLATGNVQHDYYQILIIPTLAIFFGKGVDFVLERSKDIFISFASYAVIIASTMFMLAFSWYLVRDYYNLQHVSVFAAGKAIDKLLPKDAKVVAPYGGDTTFLYYINRSGWPVFDRDLSEFKQVGADYIAFVDPKEDELNFSDLFKAVEITKTYALFDLNFPLPEGIEELKRLETEKLEK